MDPLQAVADWDVPKVAVAVIGEDGVIAVRGPDQPFAWASVTKLLTALTVLDLVEDGFVDLERPAGPAGSTVRHLLAHASGVGPEDDRVLSAPGRRRIYSNSGFEILADAVAGEVGHPFDQLLDKRVLQPLGMNRTALGGSPSHGASGPIEDLARLGRELLVPTVIRPAVLARATTPTFPELSGVLPGFGRQDPNDWGLGFEIRGTKKPHWTGSLNSPRTFGHFGQSGSFLWVDPDARLACCSLSDRNFGPWAAQAWPSLSDSVLRAYGKTS